MNTPKSHGIRNAVLIAVFLLGCGILAGRHLKNPVFAGPGPYGVSLRIAETPIYSFLPRWFLDKEAVPISRERNAGVLKSVFEVFDPSLRSFLASVPIILDSSANTAKAYQAKGYIGVSPDWDNIVGKSPYKTIYEQRGIKPEDPVFTERFKTDLLIHEYLHLIQVYKGIDSRSCYKVVARWYRDRSYGIPSPDGLVPATMSKDKRPTALAQNRMKYILWQALYNYRKLSDVPRDESWKNMEYGERYQSAEQGVEEFAYIGQEILANGSSSGHYIKTGQWSAEDWQSKKMRLLEVSPEVIALYRGVFNPEMIR